MNFNIVDIVIVAVLGLSLISGMYKGFIASGLAAVGFVAAWFGAMNLYPQLAAMIMGNSNLMDVLKYYLDAGAMFTPRALADTLVAGAVESGALTHAVDGFVAIPRAIIDAFKNNVANQLFATHTVNGQQTPWLNTMADYLNHTIWASAINVLSFLLVFVLLYLILLLVVNLLNNVFHFPLLKHFDWLLGGVFGLARGVLIVMLILSVVPMVLSIINLQAIDEMWYSSILVSWFPSSFVIPDIINSAFTAVRTLM